jgi:hypothetical protein
MKQWVTESNQPHDVEVQQFILEKEHAISPVVGEVGEISL